jgi:hypothetical protein
VGHALPHYPPVFSENDGVIIKTAAATVAPVIIKRPMVFYAVYRVFEELLLSDGAGDVQTNVLRLVAAHAMRRDMHLMHFIMWRAHWHVHGSCRLCDRVVRMCLDALLAAGYFSEAVDFLWGVDFIVRQQVRLTLHWTCMWIGPLLSRARGDDWSVFMLVRDSIHREDCLGLLAYILGELRPRTDLRAVYDRYDSMRMYSPLVDSICLRDCEAGATCRETLLHVLVRSERPDPDRLQLLLDVGRQDPLFQNRAGRTPLQVLVSRIHILPAFCAQTQDLLREGEAEPVRRHLNEFQLERDLTLVLGFGLRESKSPFRLLELEIMQLIVDHSDKRFGFAFQ